jgi:hypothetical protein
MTYGCFKFSREVFSITLIKLSYLMLKDREDDELYLFESIILCELRKVQYALPAVLLSKCVKIAVFQTTLTSF